ncbi:MAG: GNAT family N-acetyltransferase [Actinophytocola sp.]|uniref:GNAT family N-acetyltransferase n=1 Tax=Actinophytocola sp. TaxID=1872138 RepID=UPI003D6B1F08
MRTLLRADAGPSTGVGHLSRCVALAEAAVARSWRVFVVGSVSGADWLLARLSELGVPVLPPASAGSSDGAALAGQAVSLGADVVLVDHYGLGELPEVRAVARLVSMEDGRFGRRAADVVVDANLAQEHRSRDGSPLVLAGAAFAPLRRDVVNARTDHDAAASRDEGPPGVVVVMGGGAAGEAVSAVLSALRETQVPMSVRAISAVPVRVSAGPGQRFAVEPPTPTLPALLAEADLVVSAAGVTLLELCCIGTPAALVQLADNQAAGYRAAVDRGLAAGLGTVAGLPAAASRLRDLLTNPDARAALSRAASRTVDGRGAERILDACEIGIREATGADAERLLEWRNDPDTLAWSRGHHPVAEPVHRRWLASSLQNPNRLLLVAETDHPNGTVRFDRIDDDTWEVSITVAPADRGKGLAEKLLTLGEAALRARHRPSTILANIHEDNTRSLTLFRHAGYEDSNRQADGPFRWLAKRT